jgi:mono/diheme cytochrome c family protein
MSNAPEDMDFHEITTEQTGKALMQLGEGSTLKSIIFEAMRVALCWKDARDKALKKQEEEEKKKGTRTYLEARCAICHQPRGYHSNEGACPLDQYREGHVSQWYSGLTRFKEVKT